MSKRIQRNKIASSLSEFRPKKIRIRQNNHQSSEFEGDDASKTLFKACKDGDVKKIHKIMKKKPGSVNGCNRFQNTPLHLAASNGHNNVVLTLIGKNANIEAKNYQKKTPLMTACECASLEVVQTLVAEGASIFSTDAALSQTPLHYVCAGTGNGGTRFKIVQFLLEKGADPSVRDNEMWTPLHFAAQRGYNRICKLLMESGSPITAVTKDGNTPLEIGGSSGGLTIEVVEIMSRDESVAESVTYLDLCDRQLKIVPECIARFKNIRRLDLDKNEIESLPAFLLDLEQLVSLNIRGNPLNTIPSVFHNEGWDKIKRYLLSLTSKKGEWRERKLLFVGQEGVGKTTLLRCFTKKKGYKGVDTKKNLSTDGIDITGNLQLNSDSSVTFNAWDLGGQEIYYPSHQFFLTSNSVYIVVFDLSNPQFDRIDYWLQMLRALGSKHTSRTVIFVVGTHLDHPICTDEYIESLSQKLNSSFPKLRFPGLQTINLLSCKSGRGVREFMDQIVETVKKEQFSPILAEPWIKLHEYIKTASKVDHITWDEYKSWAKICELDEDQLLLATEFLSDIGTLIHFNDPRGNLKDLVILNPQWLADVMSCLITTKHTFAKDGLLPKDSIRQIFRSYPIKQHDQLIVLLENFSIINPLKRKFNGKECYLVPSLLPEDRPTDEVVKYWPKIVPKDYIQYGRVREFSFLPLGLFERMMVSVLHIEKVEPMVFWRNGLVIKIGEQYGLLEYQKNIFTLQFSVRAPIGFRKTRDNVLLLRELVEIVETIIGCYYPRLKRSTHRFVTCTHCTSLKELNAIENPFLFTEDCVVGSINSGQGALYCHHIQSPSRCISVVDLAPDLAFEDLPSINEDAITIDKKLGEGGFGVVYKGTWNDRAVAIKELTEDETGEDTMEKFQEFQRECWIMSTMVHPNITQLYGVSVLPKLRMIMQFCPGGDLFDFLHQKLPDGTRKDITPEDVGWEIRYKIALDVAKGMRYLQFITPPVIHRDLRSLNVFLIDINPNAKVRAQVADFGLSRRVAPKIKGMLATWQWLAPEIIDAESDQYDQRADIYSFGVVLWEIFTAKIPFDEFYMHPVYGRKLPHCKDYSTIDSFEINLLAMKNGIIHDKIRPTIPDNVPKEISKLISSCWQADPDDRPSFVKIVEILSTLADEPVLPVDEEVSKFLEKNVVKSVLRDSNVAKFKPPCKSIYTLEKKNILSEPDIPSECILMAACYFPKTKTIWVGYATGGISVYSLDGETKAYLVAHRKRITEILVVNDNIWSSSEDGFIYVWDANSYGVIAFWKASQKSGDVVSGLVSVDQKDSESGNIISTVWSWLPNSRTIRIWSGDEFKILNTLVVGNENDIITCIAHCNSMVWVGTRRGNIYLYNIDLDLVGLFNVKEAVQCLISQGPRVWSAAGSTIQIWEWDDNTLRLVGESNVHASTVRTLTLLPMNNQIWSGGFDGTLVIWDIKRMKPIQELAGPHENAVIRGVIEIEKDRYQSFARNCTQAIWIKK